MNAIKNCQRNRKDYSYTLNALSLIYFKTLQIHTNFYIK